MGVFNPVSKGHQSVAVSVDVGIGAGVSVGTRVSVGEVVKVEVGDEVNVAVGVKATVVKVRRALWTVTRPFLLRVDAT